MFLVEVTGSTAQAVNALLFSSPRCVFTLAINLDPALAVFQMLLPIQELLEGWRLKLGSILGRLDFSSEADCPLKAVEVPWSPTAML
jgi:hypothetical protein